MASDAAKPDNKPDKEARKANKRGAARLAAVQALYQMDLAGSGLDEIIAEFESHWIGREVEGAQYLPAEAAFFRDIVSGVVRDQRLLDPQIDEALERGWPLKRIETVLRAALRAGVYEFSTAATCRPASSCRNMPMSPPLSSSATRPVWSMPCSTSWRASCGPKSSPEASGSSAQDRANLAHECRRQNLH